MNMLDRTGTETVLAVTPWALHQRLLPIGIQSGLPLFLAESSNLNFSVVCMI